MNKSMIQGVTDENIKAVIQEYDTKEFYWPSLFPPKETYDLTWKTIEAKAGLKIMADIVARGSDIPKKQRKAFDRLMGDIPKLAISRELEEEELTEYDIMIALMSKANPDLKKIVEFWAEDTQYCWEGINARIEWMALKQISLGKVQLSNENNAAVITQFDVDYQIPAEQKMGVATVYSGTNSKPLTVDIPNAIKLGKKNGYNYKYAFMTMDTFEKVASQEEVIKRSATLNENLVGAMDTPDLATFNKYLAKKQTKYRGLQVVIIDQDIACELQDGQQFNGNPFENDVILFSEDKILGNTFWKRPVDMSDRFKSVSKANMAMHGHVLIKKFSQESPIKEVTQGIANAFPAWNLAGRSILMQIDSNSWNKN